MTGPDYKVVRADDWAGVYIDGELYLEGHSISDIEWMNLLDKALTDRKVDRSDYESDRAYSVIQGYGRCPPHWPGEE